MTNTHPELVLIGHGNSITSLAFSADGKTLVSGSYDRTAIVWDVETGKMERLLRLRDIVNSLAITPAGALVVTDGGEVWEVQTGKRLRRSRFSTGVFACSPDGRTLARLHHEMDPDAESILLTDIRTGRTLQKFSCWQPSSLAFSVDGELVAASSYDSRVGQDLHITSVYNRRTGETQQMLQGKEVFLFGVNLGPGVRLVAVSPKDNQIWNAETGEALQTIAEPAPSYSFGMMSVSLSSDGSLLAVGTTAGDVSVQNLSTSERLWQTEAHQGWIRDVVFSPEGRTLATAGDDHAIRLWDAGSGALRRTFGGRGSPVDAVAFSSDGQTITAIHKDGVARIWRITSPSCEREENHPGVLGYNAPRKPDTARNLWDVALSTLPTTAEIPDGFTIDALSPDGSLVALHLPFGGLITGWTYYTPDGSQVTLPMPYGKHPGDGVTKLYSRQADGSYVAIHRPDSYIHIWNRDTRNIQCTFPCTCMDWGTPAFSPDNRYLAMSSDNHGERICLLDVRTGEVRWDVATGDERIGQTTEFAFSPDSRLLAVGHVGFAVSIRNVQTGNREQLLSTCGDSIIAMAFSPDADVLAIGTSFEEILWLTRPNGDSNEVLLRGHTDNIRTVDYSPDGTRIATGAEDGSVRLWVARSGKLLATFATLPDGEWLIYTPEGYYTGSPESEQHLLWHVGDDLLPAEVFANTFHTLQKLAL